MSEPSVMSRANILTALIGFVGGIIGTVATWAFFLGGQWNYWEHIREAHKAGNVVNPDISALLTASDLPRAPDLSGYVRFGDMVFLRSEKTDADWILQAGAEGGLNAGPRAPVHEPRNEWYLEKSR